MTRTALALLALALVACDPDPISCAACTNGACIATVDDEPRWRCNAPQKAFCEGPGDEHGPSYLPSEQCTDNQMLPGESRVFRLQLEIPIEPAAEDARPFGEEIAL